MRKCTCKATSMCASCLEEMMAHHKKIHVHPANGWEELKEEISYFFDTKMQQEDVLLKIADFYVDPSVTSKSKTWLYLGRTSIHKSLTPEVRPTLWLYENKIHIETCNHLRFLQSHKMPFYL
jgi:hypothetical protein